MSSASKKKVGIALLSLDGGRWQTLNPLSQIAILEDVLSYYEYSKGLEPGTSKICDAFDLVVGTGTGGLIAFMLLVLKMTIQEAKDAYIRLYHAAFAPETRSKEERAKLLRDALEHLLDAKAEGLGILNDPVRDTKLRDIEKLNYGCKCAITALSEANTAHPVLFRAYRGRNASVNCFPLEALMATLADVESFPPAKIGFEQFISTDLGYLNPSEELLKEATSIFTPDSSLATVVSIGPGRPPPIAVNGFAGFPQALLEHAKDCQATSNRIESRFSGHSDFYMRFEVDTLTFDKRDLETVHDALGPIISHSRAYLNRGKICDQLTALSHSLMNRPSRLRVSQVSRLNTGVNKLLEEGIHFAALDKLEVSRDAPYNSATAQLLQRRTCTPKTRVNILEKIILWAKEKKDSLLSSLFWIFGLAGTGKSTIAQSVCKILKKEGLLASSYFCSIQLDSKDSKRIVPTIAYDLASRFPGFRDHLAAALHADPKCAFARISDQFRDLLCVPWNRFSEEAVDQQACVVVIDALDECDNGEAVLRLILDAIDHDQLHGIRFLATSRPVPRLVERALQLKRGPQIALHEVEKEEVSDDIRRFLEEQLHGRVKPADINSLTNQSDGLFIFASTLVNHLIPTSDDMMSWEVQERLGQILKPRRYAGEVGLDILYDSILHAGLSEQKFGPEGFKQRLLILQTVVSMEQATTTRVISDLLGYDVEDVKSIINGLHSVLFTRGSDEPVYIIHATFRDFVISRAQGPFICNPSSIHNQLAQSCLSQMHMHLKFNICKITSSFTINDDLSAPINSIGEPLAYVCRHWWAHLQRCTEVVQKRMRTNICQMLEQRGIFWIEVMSLLGDERRCRDIWTEIASTPSVVPQLHPLENMVSGVKRDSSKLRTLALGAADMISMFMLISPKTTSQLYLSVLSLWEGSNLECWKSQFQNLPLVISRRADGSRNPKLVFNVGSKIPCVAISLDGKYIVSGSHDNTIRIWDADTGKEIQKLDGHGDTTTSVAFSPDTKSVISGSGDRAVRIWDMESGVQLRKLYGHEDMVTAVAFSPDCNRAITGSSDKTVRIWDVQSGKRIQKLYGHRDTVTTVAFFPDNVRVISGSCDKTVQIWDARSGKRIRKLGGYGSRVTSVVFSPDGQRILSCAHDKLWIRDAESGEKLRMFGGHASRVSSAAFSPDGKRVVSGSDDMTVRIWDAEYDSLSIMNGDIGTEIQKLDGHESRVISVSFASDGKHIISSSFDGAVRVWGGESGVQPRKLYGHASLVTSVTFSPDGKCIASASHDRTVRIWDAESGKKVQKLPGKKFRMFNVYGNPVTSVAFSPDGKTVVSSCCDNTVRIWDAKSGKKLRKLKGHTSLVTSVAVSPDGKRITSGSYDQTVRVWDAETGQQLQELNGHEEKVTSVAFSHDCRHIVSGSSDMTVRIWDADSGKQLQKLGTPGYTVTSVVFSPDGKRLASGSDDKIVQIWDVESGEHFQKLVGHGFRVNSVAFSPDGKHVLSGSDDATARIWDTESGTQCLKFNGHGSRVTSVAFSPDGLRAVSGSDDATVRIWDADFGKNLSTFVTHERQVRSVASSAEYNPVISSSRDTTGRIWLAESGKQVQTFDDQVYGGTSSKFPLAGKHNISDSNDTSDKTWDAVLGKDLERVVRSISFCSPMTSIIPCQEHFYDPNLHIRHASIQSLFCTLSEPTSGDSYPLFLCPTSTSFHVRQDGWIVTSEEFTGLDRRIIWLPPSLRPFDPLTLVVISKSGFNRIDMSQCTFGEGWSTALCPNVNIIDMYRLPSNEYLS
ncbi:WD40-repeat-containing domain protein [Flagelloscypha sp. PMI_526]|nr:WD40-repeat-containing domain protein [Flagelloscypha sp. PMI_526]